MKSEINCKYLKYVMILHIIHIDEMIIYTWIYKIDKIYV